MLEEKTDAFTSALIDRGQIWVGIRDEGHAVDPPLVFQRGFFKEEKRTGANERAETTHTGEIGFGVLRSFPDERKVDERRRWRIDPINLLGR
ncbi:hypothetical protein TNCV_3294571 [Trichonephila clavipes]|nr:hypothetical protein TNCV_3294571 [Trichonephila clavipes]